MMTKLLSVSDVADLLGVSTAWVRDHASGRCKPRLPAIKLGTVEGKGLWRFLPGDVEKFIQEQRRG